MGVEEGVGVGVEVEVVMQMRMQMRQKGPVEVMPVMVGVIVAMVSSLKYAFISSDNTVQGGGHSEFCYEII